MPDWMRPAIMYVTWAWVIIVGALMITPGGIDCIACGPSLTPILGVLSIVLGLAGIAASYLGRSAMTAGR
jgi:hypothetical protein